MSEFNIHLGTSGWSYNEWEGPFYRKGEKRKLRAYSSVFKIVEIDSTFYRNPSPGTVMGWLKYSPSDSIYLSFYWQPEGRGNQPDNGDSLILQFKNPSDANPATAWKNIWGINGYKNPVSDTTFHLVMIPVKDTILIPVTLGGCNSGS